MTSGAAPDNPSPLHRPAALLTLAQAGPALAQPAASSSGPSDAWWALLALAGVGLAAAMLRARRRGRPPGEPPRRRRTDRPASAGDTQFASTQQMDTVQDTVMLEPRAAEPRRRVGRFVIERDIGRGAMGMVLLGRDSRSGEHVALKTMALGREFHGEALEEARERFFREADMAGRLRHPDIVTVREAGEDEGIAYIAMELLAGQDLSVHAQPARLLPVPHVLAITARVARALAYAHRQGVTHRDIKPANIMIEPKRDMVKVTDFGIARIMDSSQTRTGLVLGTPSFMSPEQMAGARIDGRSDLYSLGVTLFQLLTGQLPHRGDSMAALIRSIGNDAAPDVRTLRPELPGALADVVALALEKRVEVRYSDGDVMADDLAALADAMNRAEQPSPPVAPDVQPLRAGPPAEAEAGHNSATRSRSRAP